MTYLVEILATRGSRLLQICFKISNLSEGSYSISLVIIRTSYRYRHVARDSFISSVFHPRVSHVENFARRASHRIAFASVADDIQLECSWQRERHVRLRLLHVIPYTETCWCKLLLVSCLLRDGCLSNVTWSLMLRIFYFSIFSLY